MTGASLKGIGSGGGAATGGGEAQRYLLLKYSVDHRQ